MTDEQKAKIERKKAQQSAAWKRWYAGPRGQAYRQKLKEKRSADDTPSPSAK